jgi:hypothetical protein
MRAYVQNLFKISIVLVAATSMAGESDSLRDTDIENITNAVRTVTKSQIVQFSSPSTACAFTAEDGCTREVSVVIADGGGSLTVSEIDQHWVIGRWQTELLAFAKCVRRSHNWASCYGPSGHVGGMRAIKPTSGEADGRPKASQ